MPKRSKEEIIFATCLLYALGLEYTKEAVIKVLIGGAKTQLWDILVQSVSLIIDYDGGYYHGNNKNESDRAKSLERDKVKTLKMLQDQKEAAQAVKRKEEACFGTSSQEAT
jgi:hypothetical protein